MSGNLKHSSSTSTELLGFPPDARVLIVNNDDLGMYHANNAAIIHSPEARELVREEQIHLIDCRTFQQAWSASGHTTQ
jgi:hypothetical protein